MESGTFGKLIAAAQDDPELLNADRNLVISNELGEQPDTVAAMWEKSRKLNIPYPVARETDNRDLWERPDAGVLNPAFRRIIGAYGTKTAMYKDTLPELNAVAEYQEFASMTPEQRAEYIRRRNGEVTPREQAMMSPGEKYDLYVRNKDTGVYGPTELNAVKAHLEQLGKLSGTDMGEALTGILKNGSLSETAQRNLLDMLILKEQRKQAVLGLLKAEDTETFSYKNMNDAELREYLHRLEELHGIDLDSDNIDLDDLREVSAGSVGFLDALNYYGSSDIRDFINSMTPEQMADIDARNPEEQQIAKLANMQKVTEALRGDTSGASFLRALYGSLGFLAEIGTETAIGAAAGAAAGSVVPGAGTAAGGAAGASAGIGAAIRKLFTKAGAKAFLKSELAGVAARTATPSAVRTAMREAGFTGFRSGLKTLFTKEGSKAVVKAGAKMAAHELSRLPYYMPGALAAAKNEANTVYHYFDENGNTVAYTPDESEQSRTASAFFNRLLSRYTDNMTERMGFLIPELTPIAGNIVPQKWKNSIFGAFLGQVSADPAKAAAVRRFVSGSLSLDSFLGEVGEEEIANMANWLYTELAEATGLDFLNMGTDTVLLHGDELRNALLVSAVMTGTAKGGRDIVQFANMRRTLRAIDDQNAITDRLAESKLPNRSAAETEFFLDEVRNGSETLHVSAEDADALFQKAQAFAEAIGITPPVIQSANESGRTIPVSANRLIAVSAQKPEYREYQKDVLSTARFSSTGLNLEEAQNLDISEESQKKSAERYEYRSAARELADQLKSEGRSQAEINSFLFMANIGTYIGAHNRAGISASEWLRKIVFKAARTGNMQEMAELFQVSNIWTGSAANYDQPSLQYVGTGEGAQVYGWGLYGSDQEGIARHYADADARRRQQVKLYFDGAELDENGDVHYLDAPNARSPLEDILPDSQTRKRILADLRLMLTNDYYTNQRNPAKRILEDMHAHQIRIHGINDPISIQIGRLLNLKSIHRRLKHTVQRIEGNRNLYRQTFWADKEENLLLWNGKVTEDQKAQILDELSARGSDPAVVSFVNREREDWQTDDETGELEAEPEYYPQDVLRDYLDTYLDFYDATGKYVYQQIEKLLGSPQAASEFLYRAGIDGVKYPADSFGQGDGSDGWNYVAFSDKDIRVDEHIMFQTAPDLNTAAEPVAVPPVEGLDLSDTKAVRQYLYDRFKGVEVRIDSDGRLVIFRRKGLDAALKRKGAHRKAFSVLDRIIAESYPVGYERVDAAHVRRSSELKGQFVYAALLSINGEDYAATIKLDDTETDKDRAVFKDITIDKMRPLYVGHPETSSDHRLPADRIAYNISEVTEFVKGFFTNNENFSETAPDGVTPLFQTTPDTLEPSEIFDEHGDWTEKGAVAWYEKLVKAAERFAERTKQSGLVLDEAGLIAAAETALRNAARGYNPEAGQFEAYAGKAVKNAFISAARSAGRRNVATASLQEETGTGEDARTLEDRTADPDAASADEIMTEAETAERLTAALETLTEKERQVWDMAQADRGRGYITRIAETLGVSKTNVSKLYRKAEAKMKTAAADPDAVKQKTAEPAVSETVAAAQAAETVSEAAAPEQPVEKKVPYIPSDAKGMFRETPDFGGMIFLFENADATTVVHEMAHAAMETMRRMIAAGIADERMESDFAALEEWAKLDPASAAKQYTAYTQRMEKFAEGVSQIFPEYTRVKPRSTA